MGNSRLSPPLFLVLFCVAFAARAEAPGTVRDCPDTPEMVELPGGFAMSRYPVTFAEWQSCVTAGACRGGQDDHGWGRDRRPVINVRWQDAVDYAAWVSTRTGKRYGLPTESEYEHAQRAGTTTRYWWGDAWRQGLANCRDCAGPWGGRSTAPVGAFPPNPYGLYDVSGNVLQWTADCWTADGCAARVVRGGAWYYGAEMAESGARSKADPALGSYTIGIRLVRRDDGPASCLK